MFFSKTKALVITLILFLTPFLVSAQCAMCRAALATSGQKSIAEGINHGITYLMIFPYVLAAIMGFAIFQIMKKESRPSIK